MKSRGVSCCIEPAIDVDSNELLINLSKESDGFIYPAVGNHPTRCINSKLRDFKKVRKFSERDGIGKNSMVVSIIASAAERISPGYIRKSLG